MVGTGSSPAKSRDKLLGRGVGETGSGGARVAAFSFQDVARAASWRWLDEELCRRWVLEQIYPDDPCCPVCGVAVREGKALASWWQLRRVRCHSCKHYYRATKGTILQHCNLDLRQVIMLAWAFSWDFNNAGAANLAETDKKTAKLWRLRLAELKK